MSSSKAAPALLSGDAYSRASAASQTYLSRVSLGKHLVRAPQAMLDVQHVPYLCRSFVASYVRSPSFARLCRSFALGYVVASCVCLLRYVADIYVCPCTTPNSAGLLSSLWCGLKNTARDDRTELKLEFVPTLTNYFDVGRGLAASKAQWASKLPFVSREATDRTGLSALSYIILHHEAVCCMHCIIFKLLCTWHNTYENTYILF